ncbi:MAG TPA: aminotransferase class I/II-fold pyridoxal phosphate-dependent enzyme [Solirubrobacteraceae bacterium]
MSVQNYQIEGRGAKQIATSIETAITARSLAPGARLPTVRQLAADLGVSTATVGEAYRRLRERGLVTGAGRGGTRIRGDRPRSWRRSAPAVATGARNLASGNPDPTLLPDLRPALAATAKRLTSGRARLYGQAESNPELLAHFAEQFIADGIPSEHVVIVGGALDGIARTLAAQLRPGDRVAVEDPCYCGILDVLDAGDLQPVAVPIDERGARPDELERALRDVQALILTPRLHSPTGASTDQARHNDLRDVLASRPDLLVVEDDHGALIADAPLHALAQHTDRPHWAIVRSTSKALGPDLRLGALTADAHTARRILHAQQAATGWVSHLLQETTLAILEAPSTAHLLAHARGAYNQRRTALLDALAAHGIPLRSASGLNIWLPVDDETTAAQTLLAHGWVLRSGTAFRLASAPGLRITTAELLPEEAPILARDIADTLSATNASRAA